MILQEPINSRVNAHLIRGAYYVLLLLAVRVTRFALKRPKTIKRRAAEQKQAAQSTQTIAPATLS